MIYPQMMTLLAILYSTCAAVCIADDTSQRGTVVYANGFKSKVGDEWSKADMNVTPSGSRRFLGPFGPERVTLSLTELPKHRFVRLSFDLLVIQSWDGSSRRWGPDVWELSVADGPRLIHATFTNCGFFSDNNSQSFPDDHQSLTHKGWTGASEKQSLGYKWFFDRNKGKGYLTDSVYRIEVVFPHAADSLVMHFRSLCDDPKEDQSWGLDNVRVETVASAKRLSEDELNRCWKALAGDDPVLAFKSIWRMVASGKQAVEFLDRKLRVDALTTTDEIRSLLNDLENDRFQIRERATDRLREYGPGIKPILQQRLKTTKSSEVRSRISLILKTQVVETDSPAETTRRHRAGRVLKVINSPKARELQKLVNDHRLK